MKAAAAAGTPESLDLRIERFQSQYGLPVAKTQLLATDRRLALYFEACVAAGARADSSANWLLNEVLGMLQKEKRGIDDLEHTSVQLSELIQLVDSGRTNAMVGKGLLPEVVLEGKSPTPLVDERGLAQMENSSELDLLVARIVDANPAQRSGYQEGKLDLMNWFLGQVMKETRGKADPARAREILADKLGQP